MSKFGQFIEKVKAFWSNPDTDSAEPPNKFLQGVKIGWSWIYRLRSLILAIPVAIYAIIQAVRNMSRLPEFVGIGLQPDGGYSMLVNRPVAVLVPLAITLVCLLMMLCSRKVFYPWLVSLFSLLLPAVILYSNLLLR